MFDLLIWSRTFYLVYEGSHGILSSNPKSSLLNFSWSCLGTGSSCCFSHSSYNCWHFDRNNVMGRRPFSTPRALINHSNIVSLTSGALHFLPSPLSRNLFLEGSSSTNSSFKYFSWPLFAKFKVLLRLLSSCFTSAKSL